MARYVLKRLLWMIPIVFGVALLIFTIMYFTPGNPAEILLGPSATVEEVEAMEETLGLNRGFFPRLFDFLTDTFIHFDMGNSYITKGAIADEIWARLPRTVILALLTMLVSVLVGVPLGIIAALNQNRLGDRISMLVALLGVSMPNFWLALLLILLFSVKLNLLPPAGFSSFSHYILPVLSASVSGIAIQARQSRSSMLEVIRSDYVTTARAKGVSELSIVLRHELPNALIPIITLAGTRFGFDLGGMMIIEQIFVIPGMGTYLTTSLFNRDYPVVQAGAVFMAIVFSFVMLLVDLLYAFVDPRIKAQYQGKPLFNIRKKEKKEESGDCT